MHIFYIKKIIEVRKDNISNIKRIVELLAHPYTELVTDIYIDDMPFDSIENTENGFKLNIWDGSNEYYQLDKDLSDDQIEKLLKELEELF